jgi:hypothetical protein
MIRWEYPSRVLPCGHPISDRRRDGRWHYGRFEPWDLRAQVVAGNQYWGTAIDGVTPEFVTGRDWRVATGRFCTKAEEESAATVAVLGPTVDLSHPSHSLAFCLHGASQGDVDLYVMINAYWEDLRFTIQEGKGGP